MFAKNCSVFIRYMKDVGHWIYVDIHFSSFELDTIFREFTQHIENIIHLVVVRFTFEPEIIVDLLCKHLFKSVSANILVFYGRNETNFFI